MAVSKKKKASCWAWGFSCFGVFIVVSSLLLNGVLFFALLAFSAEGVSGSSAYTFTEKRIYSSAESSEKIVVIPVKGVIQHQPQQTDFFSGVQPSSEVVIAMIDQAAQDENVKAIVLDVDSPGGTASASDVIYNKIRNTKEQTGIPVVSYFGETAASGAYYVSAPADAIIAEPSSLVGSIGVIFSSLNYTELFDKLGVKQQVYKSGKHKDILSPTRLPEESDDEIMAGLVEQAHKRFVNIVLENRPIQKKDYNVVFDGRIFDTSQASILGLIDEIGYKDDAYVEAAELAGLSDYSVVEYEAELGFGSLFAGVASELTSSGPLDFLKEGHGANTSQLMLLWDNS